MRTFATIPPYTDISKLKHAARRGSKAQGNAHAKELDRAAREAVGIDWSQLHSDRTASILDTGRLVMQWRGVTIALGRVEEILPSDRAEIPNGFDVLLDGWLSMADDLYELGKPAVMIMCRGGSLLPGATIDIPETEMDRLVSSSEPLRVRCGILARAVRTALEKLYAEFPEPKDYGDLQALRRDASLHRQAAYDFAHDLRITDGDLSKREMETIVRTFIGVAPACALAWMQLIGVASSDDERITHLHRAVAFGEAVYGPLPVSLFKSEGGEPDWQAAMDFLKLRQSLGDLVKKRQDPIGQNLLQGLDEEIDRVGGFLALKGENREAGVNRKVAEFQAAAEDDDQPPGNEGRDGDHRLN